MTRWEYTFWSVKIGKWGETDYGELPTLGRQGWEAYAISEHVDPDGDRYLMHHMKRPMAPELPSTEKP